MTESRSGRQGRRITINRIAREAGVSLTTVSRALNDRPDIHPETRARILAIARELGYTPSTIARSLAGQRSQTIGLAVRTHLDNWAAQIILPIEELARTSGYEVFVSAHHARADQERSLLRAFHGRHVEGVLIVNSVLGDELAQLQETLGMPIVLISPLVESSYRYSVQSRCVAGAQTATGHLISLGHRRIGHISAPDWTAPGRRRLRGYRVALESQGIPWVPELVIEGDAHESGGLEGIRTLLDLVDPPSALFCFNDLTAVGVLQGARQKGVRVPEDLSVVGFDDVRLVSYLAPPLTTMRQDMRALGSQAIDMLFDLIAGRDPEAPVALDTTLVERGSCAPVPSGQVLSGARHT
jgi:DNA-binding LacI/PurR family transcriptional regulator